MNIDVDQAEALIRIVNAEGNTLEWTDPPEVVCDIDGIPIGVDPGESRTGTLGTVTLNPEEWELIARYLINERNTHD